MKENATPPKWADRFFEWFCSESFREIIQGDLYEIFDQRIKDEGLKTARRKFIFDMFSLMRPSLMRTPALLRFFSFLNYQIMLTHYFKMGFRNLMRNKSYTAINVMGLTLGMLSAIVIFLYVNAENSYDRFHTDQDRIYRIVTETNRDGDQTFSPGTPHPMPKALRNDFPGIEALSIVDAEYYSIEIEVTRDNGKQSVFEEDDGVAFVDHDYFEIFKTEWVEGDVKTALTEPFTGVISETLARKYFGTTLAMGKSLKIDDAYSIQIIGVIKDAPDNTDLPFNLFVSTQLGEHDRGKKKDWGTTSSSVQCYFKVKNQQVAEQMDSAMSHFVLTHRGEDWVGVLIPRLQPLAEMHYNSEYVSFGERAISHATLNALSLIGLILLLTACINFINLNTTLVFKRSKEVGIRKVLGSERSQIMFGFLSETFVISFGALFLSLALAPWVLKQLTPLLGKEVVFTWGDPIMWGFLFGILVLVSLLSGLYPGHLLARLNPIFAIKNQIDSRKEKGKNMRRGLVVVQFAITQALIICTLVMVQQMNHFNSAPVGYDKSAIVEVVIPKSTPSSLQRIKDGLLQKTSIKGVAFSNSGSTSQDAWISNFYYEREEGQLEDYAHMKMVDADFISTHGMELVVGEGLIPTDTVNRIVVNEALVRKLGISTPEEAIGHMVRAGYVRAPITGVLKDFNTLSFHEPIAPMIMFVYPQYFRCAIKLQGNDLAVGMAAVREEFEEVYPERIFEYEFLDESIASFYADERRSTSLLQLFACIAIFIGCLGLFGLISYLAARRTKEIGIRKILGASITQIMGLFTKEFMILVGIGFVVAAPLAWYFMNSWLENFSFRITMGVGVFLLGIGTALLIALLTIGYRSYRAAIADPVDSLRSE